MREEVDPNDVAEQGGDVEEAGDGVAAAGHPHGVSGGMELDEGEVEALVPDVVGVIREAAPERGDERSGLVEDCLGRVLEQPDLRKVNPLEIGLRGVVEPEHTAQVLLRHDDACLVLRQGGGRRAKAHERSRRLGIEPPLNLLTPLASLGLVQEQEEARARRQRARPRPVRLTRRSAGVAGADRSPRKSDREFDTVHPAHQGNYKGRPSRILPSCSIVTAESCGRRPSAPASERPGRASALPDGSTRSAKCRWSTTAGYRTRSSMMRRRDPLRRQTGGDRRPFPRRRQTGRPTERPTDHDQRHLLATQHRRPSARRDRPLRPPADHPPSSQFPWNRRPGRIPGGAPEFRADPSIAACTIASFRPARMPETSRHSTGSRIAHPNATRPSPPRRWPAAPPCDACGHALPGALRRCQAEGSPARLAAAMIRSMTSDFAAA